MKTDNCPANMKVATDTEQKEFLEFFSELPIALENAGLRVVHACWNDKAFAELRKDGADDLKLPDVHHKYKKQLEDKLAADGYLALHEAEKAVFGARIAYGDNAPRQHWPEPEMLPGHGKVEEARQMGNPVCILTSGIEREAPQPFAANGKFRFADRIRWWDEYLDDTPVVVGHYWRRFKEIRQAIAADTGPDLFEGVDPYQWMGRKNNVYCIDFSVGAKAIARLNNNSSEGCGLAALRWPEEEVVFDNGSRRKLMRSNNKPWSQEKYIKAWNFASEFHEGQKVPGKHYSYMNHIGLVAMEVMSCIAQDDSFENTDLAVQCAILHDVIEDTGIKLDWLKSEFGVDVANGVAALTKNGKLGTKKVQMCDSLARIKLQPREVWIVKLADRITNLQTPPKHWSDEKIGAYKKEAMLILEELGEASDYLRLRLAEKIENYAL